MSTAPPRPLVERTTHYTLTARDLEIRVPGSLSREQAVFRLLDMAGDLLHDLGAEAEYHGDEVRHLTIEAARRALAFAAETTAEVRRADPEPLVPRPEVNTEDPGDPTTRHCPRCHAAPGMPCVDQRSSGGGRPMKGCHAARALSV